MDVATPISLTRHVDVQMTGEFGEKSFGFLIGKNINCHLKKLRQYRNSNCAQQFLPQRNKKQSVAT